MNSDLLRKCYSYQYVVLSCWREVVWEELFQYILDNDPSRHPPHSWFCSDNQPIPLLACPYHPLAPVVKSQSRNIKTVFLSQQKRMGQFYRFDRRLLLYCFCFTHLYNGWWLIRVSLYNGDELQQLPQCLIPTIANLEWKNSLLCILPWSGFAFNV